MASKTIPLKKKLKISLSYFSILKDTIEIFENDPIYNLLSDYAEIEDIMKNEDKPEKLKYFYFNRTKINKLIYDNEEIISIDSEKLKNKYFDYFYLALLIEENYEIVNYKYNLNLIKEVNDLFKETNNDYLRELMISKIILVLTKNYRGIEEYDEKYENEIVELEKPNLERIKNNINILKDLNINYEDIINKKIEEIYTEIIMNLIKTNKIDDNTFANSIIKQLDLENIYVTKIMYDGLASTLKSDNNYMKKYIISNKEDLYNDFIINFYYILFKYILKKPIYIYQIPFLDEVRKKILEIIKKDREKNDNEKLKYIIDFFTNSYYTFLLNKFNTKKDINSSNYNDTSTEFITKILSRVQIKVSSNDNSNDIDNYSIIKFEENYQSSKNEYYTRLIREISNGYIIKLDNLNDLTIYQNDFRQTIATIQFKTIVQEEISTNNKSRNNINFEELKENKIFEYNQVISNIIEINENVKKKEDSNIIQIMVCSREGLIIYKLSNGQKIIENTINIRCNSCLQIKDNSYVVIGEKGIVHYKDLNNLEEFSIKYDISKDKEKDKDIDGLKGLPFRGCIKINDIYIVLTSNSILPYGKDLLLIYDANNHEFIEFIDNLDYSFVVGVNGLSLMNIFEEVNEKDETDNKNQKENKILLCACKKYTRLQKNGIIIIDTNSIGEEKKLYYETFDTNNFEVSCFCPLKIKKDKEMKITNYFLAGGLDEGKKQGMIKLYKVEKDKSDKINIKYLQDIEIEINKNFKGFNSNIECMMQSQSDGKIYVSSSDGNLTIFSDPNLDYYLVENQVLDALIKRLSG